MSWGVIFRRLGESGTCLQAASEMITLEAISPGSFDLWRSVFSAGLLHLNSFSGEWKTLHFSTTRDAWVTFPPPPLAKRLLGISI